MKPLSAKSKAVLEDIALGRGTHYRCYGMSDHGGRSRTLYALYRRGLIDYNYKLTATGRAVVGQKGDSQ